MFIFRENTEDIYAGLEFDQGTDDNKLFMRLLQENFPTQFSKIRFPETSGIGTKPVLKEGIERLIRSAIDYCLTNKRKSLTIVRKVNIMKYTECAFRNWAYAVAEREYAEQTYTWAQWERTRERSGEVVANNEQADTLVNSRVLIKDLIADIALQQALIRPEDFDVIATLNLNGHYLSDAFAEQLGVIGVAPGGYINYLIGTAVFEATHGTAPKCVDLDKVNPGSLILSGEMMLRYLGWSEAADAIVNAMDAAIASQRVTYNFARLMDNATEIKCSEFADLMIENL
jgi:isocitrate dehydrogenase